MPSGILPDCVIARRDRYEGYVGEGQSHRPSHVRGAQDPTMPQMQCDVFKQMVRGTGLRALQELGRVAQRAAA